MMERTSLSLSILRFSFSSAQARGRKWRIHHSVTIYDLRSPDDVKEIRFLNALAVRRFVYLICHPCVFSVRYADHSQNEASMFERYTEKARRVIFFARFECSTLGCPMIGSEHLLLGLLRESPGIVSLYLKVDASDLATRLRRSSVGGESIGTSVDLPLNDAAKRVLAHAAEEAERMAHTFIGTEHLLLGIMREEQGGAAAEVLHAIGVPELAEVRKSISESAEQDDIRPGRSSSPLRHSSRLKLVEEESGKKFFVHLPFQAVPRIGEAVLLTGSGEDAGEYRVVDVRWGVHLRSQDDAHVLNEVEIRVKREDKGLSLE
jgi:hypothetical protein